MGIQSQLGDIVVIRETEIDSEKCFMFFNACANLGNPFNLIDGCKIKLLSVPDSSNDFVNGKLNKTLVFRKWSDVGLQIADTYDSGSKQTFVDCVFKILY